MSSYHFWLTFPVIDVVLCSICWFFLVHIQWNTQCCPLILQAITLSPRFSEPINTDMKTNSGFTNRQEGGPRHRPGIVIGRFTSKEKHKLYFGFKLKLTIFMNLHRHLVKYTLFVRGENMNIGTKYKRP